MLRNKIIIMTTTNLPVGKSYKSMYKCELARAAGVSSETFRKWLISDRAVLMQMGIAPKQQILPPCAVRYICDKYCIDV